MVDFVDDDLLLSSSFARAAFVAAASDGCNALALIRMGRDRFK